MAEIIIAGDRQANKLVMADDHLIISHFGFIHASMKQCVQARQSQKRYSFRWFTRIGITLRYPPTNGTLAPHGAARAGSPNSVVGGGNVLT